MREAWRRPALGQRHPHAVNVRQRNAGVLAAIGAQHRRLQVPTALSTGRGFSSLGSPPSCPYQAAPARSWDCARHRARPGVRPSKTQDAQPARVAAMLGGPGRGGIQVAHLRVGHLADNLRLQLGDIGIARRVALAREQLGRHRQIPQMRQAAADILDVLVHAEYLGHHQQRGQVLLARRRARDRPASCRRPPECPPCRPAGRRRRRLSPSAPPPAPPPAKSAATDVAMKPGGPASGRQQAVELRILVVHASSPGKSARPYPHQTRRERQIALHTSRQPPTATASAVPPSSEAHSGKARSARSHGVGTTRSPQSGCRGSGSTGPQTCPWRKRAALRGELIPLFQRTPPATARLRP